MSQIIDLRKNTSEQEPEIESQEKPQEEKVEVIPEESIAPIEPALLQEIKWTTHLSPPLSKEKVYYFTFLLIIASVLVAYFVHDFLFSVVLVLSAIVLNLHESRAHRESEITIHATSISIDDERHHFADIKSFWIDYQPNIKELSLDFKKGYSQRLKIPLAETDPLEIHRTLIAYVPEKEHEHSLLDHLVRLIND